MIERLNYFYLHENSNVHRGAHEPAARSTDSYEGAREIVANFIGASSKDEIIFVRGTTEVKMNKFIFSSGSFHKILMTQRKRIGIHHNSCDIIPDFFVGDSFFTCSK